MNDLQGMVVDRTSRTSVSPIIKPERSAELDDEVEQILDRYIGDAIWRVRARNEICAAIQARGFDIFARPMEATR